jgi:hypothetical protein
LPLHEAIITNGSPTQGASNAGWEQYFACKIKYKGKGEEALKGLFLQSLTNHPEIPINLYIMVSSLLFHGMVIKNMDSHGILLSFQLPLEKSAICHSIVKTDQHRINLLWMTWFLFNRVYPGDAKVL